MKTEVNERTQPLPRSFEIHTIMVATDLTGHSERTLEYAAALARLFNARILLLHVIDPSFFWVFALEGEGGEPARIHEQLSSRLRNIAASITRQGIDCKAIVREDSISSGINRAVREEKVDLLILGAHHPGTLGQLAFGSNFNAIMHEASCPVITVGPSALPISGSEPYRLEQIVFATDFGRASAVAAPYAAALANEHDCRLTIAHVRASRDSHCDEQGLKRSLQELVPVFQCIDLTAVVLDGDSVRALSDLSRREHADLLVMGVKHATRATTMLNEGVAHEIICRAHCPVLTVACEETVHVVNPVFVGELAGTLV